MWLLFEQVSRLSSYLISVGYFVPIALYPFSRLRNILSSIGSGESILKTILRQRVLSLIEFDFGRRSDLKSDTVLVTSHVNTS